MLLLLKISFCLQEEGTYICFLFLKKKNPLKVKLYGVECKIKTINMQLGYYG
jgi:hypothetical protein